MPDVRNESVRISFTAEEKRKLVESARIEGRSLADYICERVLAECRLEDEVFLNDLARVAMPLRRAGTGQLDPDDTTSAPQELPEQQRDRMAKEVRASLSREQIEALSQFLNPAFERGLWPAPCREMRGWKISRQGLNDSVSNASNELHLHLVDGGSWVGVVYLKDAIRIDTEPLSCIDAVKSGVAKHVVGDLTNVV